MPFAVHPITPTAMSKAVVPDNIGNEFDCVANHTLAQAMRQMVSLLKQADDIFGGLESQCAAINDATKNIVKRVSHIEVIVNKMNAKNEKIPSGDLATFSKLQTHFKHEYQTDKELFTQDNRPHAIVTLYDMAGVTMVEQVEKNTALSYLCIPIPSGTYPAKLKYFNVETETKRILNEYNLTVRGRQKTGASGSYIQIKGPAEEKSTASSSSLSVPSELVSVDVSGKHFNKMTETTRSHLSVVKRRRTQKKKERPFTLTGSESGVNPFGDERLSLGEISYYSEAPNCSDSVRSFDSSALSQSEHSNPFYNGAQDLSDSDRSMTVTPLPEMEIVSVMSSSVPNGTCDNNNPFFDAVVNPFMDYTAPKISRTAKVENRSSKLNDNLVIANVQSSNSTPFEENNPFFVFEAKEKGNQSESELPVERFEGESSFELKTNQTYHEIGESTKVNNKTLDSLDGLDEVVKELELLAQMEQDLDNEEKNYDRTKQKPEPPKRYSSLFKDSDEYYSKDVANIQFVDAEEETNIFPLCLSLETKKRKVDEDRLLKYSPDSDAENTKGDKGSPDSKECETIKENISKQVSESDDNINNAGLYEGIISKAPDVVNIINRDKLTEETEKMNPQPDNTAMQVLPDMLTHVTESNGLEVNQSLDTSDSLTSSDMQARNAEQSLSTSSQSKTDSASTLAVTNSGQYRYEAPKLRIAEPFIENVKEEQLVKNIRRDQNPSTLSSESSEQAHNRWELPDTDTSHEIPKLRLAEPFTENTKEEQEVDNIRGDQNPSTSEFTEQDHNRWELPDADTSHEMMDQQWIFCEQIQEDGGRRQINNGNKPGVADGNNTKKTNKKDGFFKTLKQRLGFSSKSTKPVEIEKSKSDNENFNKSIGGPFQFQSDLPRMTSTPLTRSASTRDSRGVSCSIDGAETVARISDFSDCTKFGGDLPASYRTAALKNQHQRWSFAAASPSMYQPNLMFDQILAYNTAMHADIAMHTPPPPYQHTQPYYQPQPYPSSTQLLPLTSTSDYNAYSMGQDRHSLAMPAQHFSPSITPTCEGSYGYASPRPIPDNHFDYSLPGPRRDTSTVPLTCECPMCYHSGSNTCYICGCPNSSLKNHKITTHIHDNSPYSTVRQGSPYSAASSLAITTWTETPKPQTLPSKSIQELYSQRKSSSPDAMNYQMYPPIAEDSTGQSNLYKPTSLQDFKKLLSLQSAVPNHMEKHNADSTDGEEHGNGTLAKVKNFGSLKKPSLWVDNRYSIIQEEPDFQERRSEEDLVQGGFLV